MFQFICEKIEESLPKVENSYYRMVLLVGESGAGKTAVLQAIAKKHAKDIININFVIAEALLEVAQKERSSKIPDLLGDVISQYESPIILDNLEILFDKSLEISPLHLLQKISRNRTVLASWNGNFEDGRLTYANPRHPEYCDYAETGALIVSMNEYQLESISA